MMKGKIEFTISVALLAGFFSLGGAWAYEEGEVKNGGTISGVVKFSGNPPVPKKLEITKDQEVCGKEPKFSEELVVSASKGIKNAVISLADIKKGKKLNLLNPTPVLDQQGCTFHPHVLLVPAGAAVDILNNDGILHNFHTFSVKNLPINKAQPKFKKKMTEKFEKPEIVKVACDAHNWMSAWIVVAEHPYYAVTDANGAFTLKDVPPGTYQLQIWHETLGTVTKPVTVKGGEETKVAVELGK